MEGLSFELQDDILRFLELLDDIKAISLLNRHFRDLATPHLFRCVSLTVRTESFNKLDRICDSPLSQYVRCLHYNIWELPPILEREWNQALRRSPLKRKHDQQGHLPQYEDYHESYRGQVHHDGYNLLAKAFHRLPGLRSLEISEREPRHCSNSEKRTGLGRFIEAATRSHEYIPSDRASAVSGKTSRALEFILAHGAVTKGSLVSLTLEGFRWRWLDMRDVRMWHEESILNGALRNLRRLQISVVESGREIDDGDMDIPDPVAAVDVWRTLIGCAEGLKQVEVLVRDGRGLSWIESNRDFIHSGVVLLV